MRSNAAVAWFVFGTVCLWVAANIAIMGLMRAAKDDRLPPDEIEME